jgi:hypothetical protein
MSILPNVHWNYSVHDLSSLDYPRPLELAEASLAGCGKTYLLMKSLSAPSDKTGFLPLVLSRLRGRLQRGKQAAKTFSAAC